MVRRSARAMMGPVAAASALALLGGVVAPTSLSAASAHAPVLASPVAAVPVARDQGAGLGAAPAEALTGLFDSVKVAAGVVVASRLQPGGGSASAGGDSDWRPPADLRTPSIPPVAAPPAPTRKATKYEVLGAAYARAAEALSEKCHMPFPLLLGIGEVEATRSAVAAWTQGTTWSRRSSVWPCTEGGSPRSETATAAAWTGTRSGTAPSGRCSSSPARGACGVRRQR